MNARIKRVAGRIKEYDPTISCLMMNLDRILKSRDISLLTKVPIVKAMVFPVVNYGCDSWAIKKAMHQIIDAFEM